MIYFNRTPAPHFLSKKVSLPLKPRTSGLIFRATNQGHWCAMLQVARFKFGHVCKVSHLKFCANATRPCCRKKNPIIAIPDNPVETCCGKTPLPWKSPASSCCSSTWPLNMVQIWLEDIRSCDPTALNTIKDPRASTAFFSMVLFGLLDSPLSP